MNNRWERYLLLGLDLFLAVTAIAGGLGLWTGAIAPGVELLQGSPFTSYLIPGVALTFLVGGSATLATWLLRRRPAWGILLSGLAGLCILLFELVEILVIGSAPGIARNLQLLYMVVGLFMAGLATALWLGQRHSPLPHSVQSKGI
ncbi:MAG: hypothetical protein KF832_26745 [Caldilineaceae bacterium]|nr:hypothetical protein [Caldilineaceae bacterium]